MHLRMTLRLASVCGALLHGACGSSGDVVQTADAGGDAASARDVGPERIGFAQKIFPILQQGGCGECHTLARQASSHWAFTTPAATYDQLVNARGFNHCTSTGRPIEAPGPNEVRVVPGSPTGSMMLKKLEAPWEMCGIFYGRMPPSPRARLPLDQIALIRAWIEDGALP